MSYGGEDFEYEWPDDEKDQTGGWGSDPEGQDEHDPKI